MIKEIKINSEKEIVKGMNQFSVGDDLQSIITTLENHAEQYCIVVEIVKNSAYQEKENRINSIRKVLSELTKRELEVLGLAVKGLSNKEISEKLFISLETIKSHRKNIISKSSVKNIEDLKRILFEANSLIDIKL